MIKNTDDILDIIKTRVNKDDLEFEALFNDKELLKNVKFQRVMEEINTYHAEILAQNEELRDKEKILLQNEKELRTLFHDSPVPYIVLDDQFKVIKYNIAASTMLKIDKDRNFYIFSFLNGIKSYDVYFDAIKDPNTKNFEIEIIDYKKEHRTLDVTKGEVYINNKLKTILSLKDITEKKEKEKLLNEKRRLESLNELINHIAHHWRQPLNFISISAGAIIHSELDLEERNRLLQNILDTTSSLSETINIFRRIVNRNEFTDKVRLFDVIKEALMYKSKTFNDHNVKVINNISDIDPSDCKNIKIENFYEAISNILSNSIDAFEVNDIKKPTIKLNLAESEDNISLIIEDNGGGIREDVIPNIFEPYTTTKHESQGTGLGLFLTYKIVTELLNGTIDVKNVTNGARFTINIPKN